MLINIAEMVTPPGIPHKHLVFRELKIKFEPCGKC